VDTQRLKKYGILLSYGSIKQLTKKMSRLVQIFNVLRKQGQKVRRQLKGNIGHIFNLGHGITPDVDSENIDRLCTYSKR
jgi:uroporphyrinogen-III decarboxylase